MQPRTEILKIAEQMHAIATDRTEPLTVGEVDRLSALHDELEIVLAVAMQEAALEAWREANRAAA